MQQAPTLFNRAAAVLLAQQNAADDGEFLMSTQTEAEKAYNEACDKADKAYTDAKAEALKACAEAYAKALAEAYNKLKENT